MRVNDRYTHFFLLVMLSGLIITSSFTNQRIMSNDVPSKEKGSNSVMKSNEVITILYDISHGLEVFIPAKVSPMGGMLEGTGEFVVKTTTMKQSFTESDFVGVDIFVIMFPDYDFPYSAQEIQIVKDFWNSGGSILFVGGLTYGETHFNNTVLNNVISTLGFNLAFSTLQDTAVTRLSGNLPNHDIFYNMDTFGTLKNPVASVPVLNSDPNIENLTFSNSGRTSFAVFDNDSHRAAFIGTYNPFLELKAWDGDPYLSNHYQFQYNLMNWLGFQPSKELTDIFPINVYTGIESPHTITEIKQLLYYQGICHFHTELSSVVAPYDEMVNNFDSLGHQFVVVTDYNTVAGGPALRAYLDSQGRDDIAVIDGLELTGENQTHNIGWFNPGNGTLISEFAGQSARIGLFHDAGSPIFLAHPSWLIDPNYPRIWDHDLYPFDGYELVNSAFMQGGGNLAMYPFYGAADMSGDESAMFRVWNYVFTEEISDDPDWWTEAVMNRKLVIYVSMGDYFVGDKLLVDEIVGRLNDEHSPEILITSPTTITPNSEVTLDATITDASRIFTVNLSVTVNEGSPETYTLDSAVDDYSHYVKNLGSFSVGDSVMLALNATDELGYSAEQVVEFFVEPETTTTEPVTTTPQITQTTTTTTPETDGSAPWLTLPIFIASISTFVIVIKKRRIFF